MPDVREVFATGRRLNTASALRSWTFPNGSRSSLCQHTPSRNPSDSRQDCLLTCRRLPFCKRFCDERAPCAVLGSRLCTENCLQFLCTSLPENRTYELDRQDI